MIKDLIAQHFESKNIHDEHTEFSVDINLSKLLAISYIKFKNI